MGPRQVSAAYGVLIDLDLTLVDSSRLKALRDAREWRRVQDSLNLSHLYPYGVEFLRSLHSAQLPYGIVTSSPRTYAEAMVRHHGLPIKVVTAYHDTRAHKPHPAPLLHGLAALGAATGIYVGDDKIDAQAANAAGIAFAHVNHAEGEPLRTLAESIVEGARSNAR